jgi:hypothetical protein
VKGNREAKRQEAGSQNFGSEVRVRLLLIGLSSGFLLRASCFHFSEGFLKKALVAFLI